MITSEIVKTGVRWFAGSIITSAIVVLGGLWLILDIMFSGVYSRLDSFDDRLQTIESRQINIKEDIAEVSGYVRAKLEFLDAKKLMERASLDDNAIGHSDIDNLRASFIKIKEENKFIEDWISIGSYFAISNNGSLKVVGDLAIPQEYTIRPVNINDVIFENSVVIKSEDYLFVFKNEKRNATSAAGSFDNALESINLLCVLDNNTSCPVNAHFLESTLLFESLINADCFCGGLMGKYKIKQ